MNGQYAIYYHPQMIEEGQPEFDVIFFETIEDAFIRFVELKKTDPNLIILQVIGLKVELC